MEYFQFPWRILSLVIFYCAILAGSVVEIFKSKVIYISFICLLVLSTYSYAKPPYMFDRTDSYYTKNPNFIFATNSIGNGFNTMWLPLQSSLASSPAEINSGSIILQNSTPTKKTFSLDISQSSNVVFNTAYFPGWAVYVGGKEIESFEKNGKIGTKLSGDEKQIELIFQDTFVRTFSKLITVAAILIILTIFFKNTVLQLIYGYRNR